MLNLGSVEPETSYAVSLRATFLASIILESDVFMYLGVAITSYLNKTKKKLEVIIMANGKFSNFKWIVRFCRSGNRLSIGQMCSALPTKARV